MESEVNNDVLDYMQKRGSVPAKFMSGPGPDDRQLQKILEISCRVPDHGKLTPWRLIRYGEEKCIALGQKVLARAIERAAEKNKILDKEKIEIEKNRFCRTPVVICIVSCAREHSKIPEWEQILSSGAVAMNMLIAANAFGFDAQWLTEWCAYDEALRQDFGLRDNERVVGFVHIGTRLFPKTERDRPCLDDIYTYVGN